MREDFLNLVKEVKKTGIAKSLCNTTNAEELKTVCKKFEKGNSELIKRIRKWGKVFNGEEIFFEGEEVEDPIEIAVIIYITNRYGFESEIFESSDDLAYAMEDISGKFAEGLADFIFEDYVCEVTPEDIFNENH